MYDKKLLKANSIDMLRDDFLSDIRDRICSGQLQVKHKNIHEKFIEIFDDYVNNNNGFTLLGLDKFLHKEIIMGCHHYLDSLMIKYGREDLQVLEHDYTYYSRLDPNRVWSKPGSLIPNLPLTIATPFPGYLGIHPEYDDIIAEATEKNIDVHLDGAWLSCSTNLEIDLNPDCIKSVGISLSKGYGANWNRIGLRYTKDQDLTDPVTIFNRGKMIHRPALEAGILLLENIPVDYMWNTYGNRYNEVVEQFDLTPGNIIFAAYGKDRIIYSLSHLLLG